MFRVDDKVIVIDTNKKGKVVSYDEIEEGVYEVDVEINGKVERFLSYDLRRDGPIIFSAEDLKNIFRYSIDYSDLIFTGHDYEDDEVEKMLHNYKCLESYAPDLDDMIALLMNLKVKKATVEDYYRWKVAVNAILEKYYKNNLTVSDNFIDLVLLKNAYDVVALVFHYLDDIEMDEDDFNDELIDDLLDLDGLIREIQLVKENSGKELIDREYSDQTMRNFLLHISKENLVSDLIYPYELFTLLTI